MSTMPNSKKSLKLNKINGINYLPDYQNKRDFLMKKVRMFIL